MTNNNLTMVLSTPDPKNAVAVAQNVKHRICGNLFKWPWTTGGSRLRSTISFPRTARLVGYGCLSANAKTIEINLWQLGQKTSHFLHCQIDDEDYLLLLMLAIITINNNNHSFYCFEPWMILVRKKLCPNCHNCHKAFKNLRPSYSASFS